jgi:hypothetical protein
MAEHSDILTSVPRLLASLTSADQFRTLWAGEPLVFHCNHYNYWLQHTLRLDPSLAMDAVIRAAAEASARAALAGSARELGLDDPAAILRMARDSFAELGFGMLELDAIGPSGGLVRTPVSHYGQMLTGACVGTIERDQNLFDQGFAAAAVGVAYGLAPGSLGVRNNRCMSLGAEVGQFELVPITPDPTLVFTAPGVGGCGGAEPDPAAPSNIDEPAILAALATLDFSGNEEGLIPRFGVILTRHLANFYDRISFEFVHRMQGSGMQEEAEQLLIEAGRRCAFNTFGGIMLSAEWDAVIRPQCQTREDWAHGMAAVVNALGWGCWRIVELSPSRAVIRIWDDYESTGWLGMYGQADRPVSFLGAGGCEGLMSLIYAADIASGPTLDEDLYRARCGGGVAFRATQTRCLAQGDGFSEFVVEVVEAGEG